MLEIILIGSIKETTWHEHCPGGISNHVINASSATLRALCRQSVVELWLIVGQLFGVGYGFNIHVLSPNVSSSSLLM